MANNQYQLYLQSCINLVQTLIIKSSSTANLVNEYINLQLSNINELSGNYYDPEDETTWKYYMNLSGQYFLPFDVEMYIKSLDTLEEIKFTPENLLNNPLTYQAYQFGTSYYNKLVGEYPNQVTLINSILYPTNIDTAIAAKDGTILAYSTDLIDSNEYNLIPKLQEYIYTFKNRWNNTGFEVTDSLYIVANLGIMYLNLVPMVLNIRLANAKTPLAHSFHVQQYLASHNGLDQYTNEFTLKEQLYLYRNINYIQRRAGHQKTFNKLINNFIIPNEIDLVSYELVKTGFDSNNNSIPSFKEISLVSSTSSPTYYNLSDILNMEASLYDNANFISNYNTEITNQVGFSRYTKLPTKIVKTNTTNEVPLVMHTKQDVIINTWLYLAFKGYYTCEITFTNPVDQNNYTLTPIDAFLYMVYIEAIALGISLEYVPSYFVERAPITHYLSLSSLTKFLTTDNIPTSSTSVLSTLLTDQIPITNLNSVAEFQSYCDSLYAVVEAQDIIVNSIGDIDRKAQYKIMIDRFYVDEIINFPDTFNLISTWLLQNNLPSYSYTINQAQVLLQAIVQATTGHNYNINKGINFNRNLVEVVQTLSSYNVQFLITENKTVVYIIESIPGIGRIGDGDLVAQYADSEGTVYATITSNADYADYSETGYIGNAIYNGLSPEDKASLSDIYSL